MGGGRGWGCGVRDFLFRLHLVAFGCIFPGVSFGGGGWDVAFWGWQGRDFSIFVAFWGRFATFCAGLGVVLGVLGVGDAPTLTLPRRRRGFIA